MARLGLRSLVGVALGMLLALLGVGVAAACSCVEQTTQESVDNADVVARVLVVGKDLNGADVSSADPVTFSVQTATVWKGDVPATFHFTSPASSASCGLEGVEEGQDIILFATEEGDGFTSNLCSGTTLATEELINQITALQGEGTLPAESEPAAATTPGSEAGWLVPAVIAVVAAIGVVWVYARRHMRKRDAAIRYAAEVKHSDTPTEPGRD